MIMMIYFSGNIIVSKIEKKKLPKSSSWIIRNTFQNIFPDIIIADSNHSALLSVKQHVELYYILIIYTESIRKYSMRYFLLFLELCSANWWQSNWRGSPIERRCQSPCQMYFKNLNRTILFLSEKNDLILRVSHFKSVSEIANENLDGNPKNRRIRALSPTTVSLIQKLFRKRSHFI